MDLLAANWPGDDDVVEDEDELEGEGGLEDWNNCDRGLVEEEDRDAAAFWRRFVNSTKSTEGGC